MNNKNIVIVVSALLSIIIFGGVVAWLLYNKANSSAFGVEEDSFVYIDENKNYAAVVYQLEEEAGLKDTQFFMKVANVLKYPDNIKVGRYKITPNMTYLEAIRLLRSGAQEPVKLTFNNIRLKTDLVNRIGEQLMFTNEELLALLNDSAVTASYGFDTTTIVAMFIPNTYEMYWTVKAADFMDRMHKEYNRFWTKERTDKAAAINLTPIEVSILASIVEEETASQSEYPIVAGLYINRLKKGMLLQADPTVKFAVGDVTLKRILFKHLEVESPYNTYKYVGLPPGPIRIPSIKGIDAVLNYKHHPYIYMCAKEDFSGTHNFAVTLAEHNRNAKRYQSALNKR
ncbi:UPF0755 protein [Dysgonomonadaceae bacterium PH5-43]|nr:UPF0755 protein [Dysgonomonadaceae bacterium PH5-43]